MSQKTKKRKMRNNPVLLLNQHNLPLNTMPQDRALHMWTKGKADFVETHDDKFFHVWGDTFNLPTVMRMRYFVNITKQRQLKDFYNRLNVWRRDKGTCQYCGKKVKSQNFTVDHVIPRKQHGKTCWTNIVTCCHKCNNFKDCRTPKEAGMKLLKKPVAPDSIETVEMAILERFKRYDRVPHKSWEKYINPLKKRRKK